MAYKVIIMPPAKRRLDRYVYYNTEATELLLKIILKRDDITVKNVVGQREFQIYAGPDLTAA